MPRRAGALLLSILAVSACDDSMTPVTEAPRNEAEALPSSYLVPVPYPDLSGNEEALVEKVEQWRTRLRRLTNEPIADEQKGTVIEGFGVLARTFHSFGLWRAASACYENAAQLDPEEIEWPYLHGVAQRAAGHLDAAVVLFERALEIDAENVPTLVRLARCERLRNRPERAEPLLRKAIEIDERCGAAHFQLAKLFAARDAHQWARISFEGALALLPHASEIHYPLAMTLRELGEVELARQHLERRGDRRATLNDPLLRRLAQERTGGRPFLVRGTELMKANRLQEARAELTKAVAASPDDAAARLNLGLTLLLLGLPKDAEAELAEALRIDPGNDKAQINLGVILAQRGDDEGALRHFRAAVEVSPSVEALLNMGHCLRRLGRHARAESAFERALVMDPANGDAHISLAYTRMRRELWKEARDALEAACRARSDDLEPAHALARLLASAPDAEVRDGERALTLARTVVRSKGRGRGEHGATLAMALAEVARFDEAVRLAEALQPEVARTGDAELATRLAAHLERYRAGKPCREPWPPDHPILSPPTLSAATSSVTPR